MKILILGKGGREHAFAEAFSKSDLVQEIYVCPGNPGMKITPKVSLIEDDSIEGVMDICKYKKIKNVLIGSEAYLSQAYADHLRAAGLQVVGPNEEGSRLESSKSFCKHYLVKAEIPTASGDLYDNLDELKINCESLIREKSMVLKWDHLAAGKGVFVCHDQNDLDQAYLSLKKLPGEFQVVLEDYLPGDEISAFVYVKNNKTYYFGSACDYKRRTPEESSPNTGGMGAFSPNNKISEDMIKTTVMDYSERLLLALQQDQTEFEGFLFWGIMLCEGTPYVLEINTRFGDPETQVVLPRIANDLAEFFFTKNKLEPIFIQQSALHLVKVDPGYPLQKTIENKIHVQPDDEIKVYFSGVIQKGEDLYTRGGRILGITAMAETLEEARNKVYAKSNLVSFDREDYRKDIGC